MAINERLIHTAGDAGSSGSAEAEQGLILHLDANDVDSYDGDGAEWVDISTFEKTIPISDNASNLKCHLNFTESTSYDGTGTTVTDISDESNDFSFVNVTSSDFGKDNGGYLDFDGTNDYLQRTSSISGIFNSNYTLEWWIKPDEANNFTLLFSKNATNSALLIGNFGGSAGQLEVYRYKSTGGTTSGTFTSSGITSGQWNHVAIVFSGTVANLYVDGNYKSQITGFTGTYFSDFTETNLLGNYSSDTFDTDGKLGVFRIYDIALSASDIGQNYRHGRDTVYTDLIPDTDLKLHLDAASFDGSTETPSTWTDSSGNSNNGTISGATFDSELGNWLNFDGSGDYVSITDSSPVTLEMWVKPDLTSGIDALAGHNSITSNYIYWNSGDLTVNGAVFTDLDKVTDWTHIAIVESGSNLLCYKNGVLLQTLAGALGTYNLIGARTAGTAQYLNGKIGQLRIYSSALTQDQIRQNYNFTKPSYPNGNDGAINGATWYPDGYFDFDGSNDYVSPSPLPYQSSNALTITGWINPDNVSQLQGVFSLRGSSSNQVKLAVNIGSDSALILYSASTSTFLTLVSGNTNHQLSAGNWHFITASIDYESKQFAVYLDGNLVSSGTNSSIRSASTFNVDRFDIGANYNNQFFNGQIDSVKVYDRILSSTEITALHNEGQ